ncbi:MAG: sugar-binding domain-containing protein [Eubacteriales bacterium]|nr:sugar-binding domain-containing protein [Eubacteriales bacterium]
MSISQEHRYYLKLKALYYLYEEGHTQTEIAKRLNISRVTLGRLLDEAKEEGMIKFEIIDVRGAMKTLQLEERLRRRFGLQDIKLVDCPNADSDSVTKKIASEAAAYFEQLVHSNMKIGLTWGRTLNSMIESLAPDKSIKDLMVYTLVGGSSQSVDFQPNVLAQHIIDKYGGRANILTAPFMCQSEKLCAAIKQEPTIASILDASHNLDATLVGIGEEPVRDADHLSDYPFDTAMINELVDARAAGDICGNFFTIDGQLCETTLKNRIVSIDIRDLPNHKQVIGIGGGEKKVHSLLGALNGHYLHVLITDVQTAEKVLALAESPVQ